MEMVYILKGEISKENGERLISHDTNIIGVFDSRSPAVDRMKKCIRKMKRIWKGWKPIWEHKLGNGNNSMAAICYIDEDNSRWIYCWSIEGYPVIMKKNCSE